MLVNFIHDGLQQKNERDGLLENKRLKNNECSVNVRVL